ncbi:MAG: D-glycero-beta-D-manno-heptose 1-phosphate adenylyltransferase [Candidatus Melainabacteria bacterium]|jgi:glycerol-3-phosphate cytidylyltransferase|nr:D-glycero-beta-D-manno-heptose 1-phosphate adenylyltransferase [Candidatus Melainabacteria bacterium]
MGTVLTKEALAARLNELRDEGKTIVSTNGCFDILHVGHVRILKQSKALGNILVVGINSDASVKRLKGEDRPINNQDDRAELLSSLECVDFVSIFDEGTPVEFLKSVKPNIHVKGADYKPENLEETPVVESFGGEVRILPLVPQKSTTSLVEKIRS